LRKRATPIDLQIWQKFLQNKPARDIPKRPTINKQRRPETHEERNVAQIEVSKEIYESDQQKNLQNKPTRRI